MRELKKYLPFLSFFVLNSIVIYLASFLRPSSFELGSATVPENIAALWAGALLTFIVWVSKPIIESFGIKPQGTALKFLFYWLANSAVIWVLARFAEVSGLGISRFYWAIVLGFTLNIAQWSLWQILKPQKAVSK